MDKVKRLIQSQVKNKTLQMFEIGCDKTNFKIIELLLENKDKALTMKDLETEIGLTTKPLYNRVNDLISVGLVERNNGVVIPTEILYDFKDLINHIMGQVESHIYTLMEKET